MKEEEYIPNDEPLLDCRQKDPIEKISKKLDDVEKKFEDTSLAMEMLKELKRSGTRKFIIILLLIAALIGTNIGWLIYESQFETIIEDSKQTIDDIQNPDNSNFTQTIN